MKNASQILIATTNPAKKRYLAWVVKDTGLKPIYFDQIRSKLEVEEKGKDFKENAAQKAREYSKLVDHLTICTDGGLVIPALGDDWDRLLTHRFAGLRASDYDRVRELLSMMEGKAGNEREVFFEEAIAIARHGMIVFNFLAKGPTRLLAETCILKNFVEGFWIANLLFYPELGKSYSELTEAERMEMTSSHWQEFKEQVEQFISKLKGNHSA